MVKRLLKLLIGGLIAIALIIGIAPPSMAQTGIPDATYIEGKTPVRFGKNISFTGGKDYRDGELRFRLNNGTAQDQMTLTSAADPNAKGAISVDQAGNVFLGTGTEQARIGTISTTENGANGQDLVILFSSPLKNAGFETGDLTGWTPFQENYSKVQNLTGQSISYDFTRSNQGTGVGRILVGTPSREAYTVSLDPTTVGSGKYALRLVSSGTISGPTTGGNNPSGNGSMHGPYVRSAPFKAYAGDTITLDFSAQQGDDAYEVLGFLIGPNNSRIPLFSKRGDTVPFTPASATIPADGDYQFEFVCGTYDKTGGLVLGASLFVDNVRMLSSVGANDAVLTAIAQQVTFANTSDHPDTSLRKVTVSRQTASHETDSTLATVAVVAVNDGPAIALNQGTSVNEGQSVTLVNTILRATDPDDDDAGLTYTLTGGPHYGKLQVSGVDATSFTQADLDAGVVSYVHDGSETIGDTFNFIVQDGGEDGATAAAATFKIGVNPVNDPPVLVTPMPAQKVMGLRPTTIPLPPGTFTDPEGDTLTFSAIQGDGSPLPAWFNLDPATGTLTGTPPAGVKPFDVVITADDGQGGKATTQFNLKVNTPPVVVHPLADVKATAGSTLAIALPQDLFHDPDGDPLVLTATLGSKPLPTWLTFDPATGTFKSQLQNQKLGNYCITVTADDGQGGTAATCFTLTVQSALATKAYSTNPDNGHLYYLTAPMTWTQAQAEARSVDGNLVTINNEAEQDWLWGIFGRALPFWIGLNDARKEGVFEWVSGQPFDYDYPYDNWTPDYPNGGKEEDYGVMNFFTPSDPLGGWADVTDEGPGYGEAVPGIVEVEPEGLGYNLNLDGSAPGGCTPSGSGTAVQP